MSNIKYTYVSTDGTKCDIVTVSKDLLQNASMSADKFDDLVIQFRKENISLTEAYYKAEDIHEHYFGCTRYSSHDSYKSWRYQRHNKK